MHGQQNIKKRVISCRCLVSLPPLTAHEATIAFFYILSNTVASNPGFRKFSKHLGANLKFDAPEG